MRRRLLIVAVIGAAIAAAAVLVLVLADGDESESKLELKPFGGGNFSFPYYVAGAPDDPDRVFVVQGRGQIRLVLDGAKRPKPFLDIRRSVCFLDEGCGEESGLLSMAFAPDYARSGRFYVFYTRDSSARHDLVIEEFRRSERDPNVADVASRRTVLEIPHPDVGAGQYHNGGQLQFGPDGLLYIGVGDGELASAAQDPASLLGKILRIDPRDPPGPARYSAPRDNPFAGEGVRNGADEVYVLGLRNPWRFSFDAATGNLLIGDVGHAAWEEVDFLPAGRASGANLGWDCFEGNQPNDVASPTCPDDPDRYVGPAIEYENPGGPNAISAAVAGGYVVRDGALPTLEGRYIYADSYTVLDEQIRSAVLDGDGGASDDEGTGLSAEFVVSFGEDACNHVYVASSLGPVYRIEPATGELTCQPEH